MSFRLKGGCVCSLAFLLAAAGSACAQTPGDLPVYGVSSTLIDSQIQFTFGANLGIGQAALQNPAGSLNTAFGSNAMYTPSISSASANSAFGYGSLQSNYSGGANTALSLDSLHENYSGNANVGVGVSALENNYSGGSNTAIGLQALQSLGTGVAETAAASDPNVTMDSNTAIGSNSLTGILSGRDNVAIGDGAGDDVATGGSNAEADQSIYLGASSMPQGSGEQNEIVIGWMAQGNGSNTVTIGNNSITTTSLKGNVGIGTNSPGADLATLATPPPPGTPILEVKGDIALALASGGQMIYADGTTQATAWNGVLSGGDYAESVNVSGDREEYEPGDVLVIDPASEGNFLKSSAPYSTAVTGIYSTKPGVVGRRQLTARAHMKEEVPMAMTGIVPTKVSAENGPIKPGDLLVTSSKPGYAMKGTDRTQMLGAVIGKAIGHLNSGTGVIEAVVTLQ